MIFLLNNIMNYEYVKITDRVIRKTNVNCLSVSFHKQFYNV